MTNLRKDECYQISNAHAAFITFYLDDDHRRAFNAHQLLEFSLVPNPAATTDKNQSPQKLSLLFDTAAVVVLGGRLDMIADYLGDNRLTALGVVPKRSTELERPKAFIASITITPMGKE